MVLYYDAKLNILITARASAPRPSYATVKRPVSPYQNYFFRAYKVIQIYQTTHELLALLTLLKTHNKVDFVFVDGGHAIVHI
jgi:hypothetical protein